MSELVVCAKKIPEGFSFDTCDDMEMVIELYEEYYKWRSLFRKGGDTAGDQARSQEATG